VTKPEPSKAEAAASSKQSAGDSKLAEELDVPKTEVPRAEPGLSFEPPSAEPEIAAGTETLNQTMREALRDAMAEEMRRDPDVFLMGEEVAQYQGAYKVSQGLLEEFGERRVIDTPITEQGFAGVGVGAAFAGLKPIVEFMTWNFAMQAIDQIVNSAGKTHYMSGGLVHVPIVFRGPNGAAARVAAQHSQCYSAWYAHVPGLKVIAPCTPADAKGLLKSAIRGDDPVLFMEHKGLYRQGYASSPEPGADFLLPFGVAAKRREGTDITVITWGYLVQQSLEAARTAEAQGISVEVIDLRTLNPLDEESMYDSVKKTSKVIVAHEDTLTGGFGAEIVARITLNCFEHLDAPVLRVAAKDIPVPYSPTLEDAMLPNKSDVLAAIERLAAY